MVLFYRHHYLVITGFRSVHTIGVLPTVDETMVSPTFRTEVRAVSALSTEFTSLLDVVDMTALHEILMPLELLGY